MHRIRSSLLQEVANSIDNLGNMWVNVSGDTNKFRIGLMEPGEGIWAEYGDEVGFVAVRKLNVAMGKGAQNCYETYLTEAPHGWGPFLYDIAMEIATSLGGELISDRNKVSDDARSIWKYYKTQRSDVHGHQLDDMSAKLITPDNDSDDVVNPPPWNDIKHVKSRLSDDQEATINKFRQDPQTSSYTKEISIIPKLKKMKKFESSLLSI